MKLADLINDLPVELSHGTDDIIITNIVEDSRLANPGDLFIARSGGHYDGRQFISEAVSKGASCILSDDKGALPDNSVGLLTKDVPLATAMLAERFHGHPSRRLKLVGITGTNGKTTTAHIVHQILNASGIHCGQLGTIQTDDGATITPTRLTTPPPLELSEILERMIENGCKACVMEASSHAMDQRRTAALAFDVGVFTNLTGDHMDYHGTPQAYLQAKQTLFRQLADEKKAIINIDDPASRAMFEACSCEVMTTSVHDEAADYFASIGAQSIEGIDVILKGLDEEVQLKLPLIGTFNVSNALQAAAVCHQLGVETQSIVKGLIQCTAPPGRLEPVEPGRHEIMLLVDYAHTDDALENVLEALKPIMKEGNQLITVFGCGGDRDRTKRPRMAKVACRSSDIVIITSDNPRTEDPQAIIDEIMTGVPESMEGHVETMVDRAEAIHRAVALAHSGDVVLIAGKGHEDYQLIDRQVHHFDDREVAAQALQESHKGASPS
ncbi:MAG: UDP-N-acetylmuramoyl-L-alanyl-D-glutamate--2,6-diaminopimelate ligase [Planctomycetota bacterium]|nr:UDP-N-acetylmuramoyl-L-alanyl-D-glutamate--2,6-diaminopimelate ligase [Planctomycetota bacterium]